MDNKKCRAPNFTEQECILLAQLMGEEYKTFNMSCHRLDKSRFNERITSSVKSEMWSCVTDLYNNSQTSGERKKLDLQKKWENLVGKHRAIYAEFQRNRNQTGSGPVGKQYSLVTEAIMDVIGKESVAVLGIGAAMDTTLMKSAVDVQMPGSSKVNKGACSSDVDVQILESPNSKKRICSCMCNSDQELIDLKKKKLKLQIEFYERQLAEQ